MFRVQGEYKGEPCSLQWDNGIKAADGQGAAVLRSRLAALNGQPVSLRTEPPSTTEHERNPLAVVATVLPLWQKIKFIGDVPASEMPEGAIA